MSRTLVRAGAVAAILLTAGCGWIPQPKPGTESGPDGELMVVSRTGPGDAVMQALFEGTIFLNESGCVAGRSLDGYEVALLFPRDSHFESGDELIIRSGNHNLALDVPVALGGGFASLDGDRLADVPDGCMYDETFLVQTFGTPGSDITPSPSPN